MWLFGDLAGMLVAPVCSWLAVLGTYVLARALLPGWAALLAALAAASNPLINIFSADQVSHPASIAFLTWGFALFFLGAKREQRPSVALFWLSGLGSAARLRRRHPLHQLPPAGGAGAVVRPGPDAFPARRRRLAGRPGRAGTAAGLVPLERLRQPAEHRLFPDRRAAGLRALVLRPQPALLLRLHGRGRRSPVRPVPVRVRRHLAPRLAPGRLLHGLAPAAGAPVRVLLLPAGAVRGLPALPTAAGRALHAAGAALRARDLHRLREPADPAFADRLLVRVSGRLGRGRFDPPVRAALHLQRHAASQGRIPSAARCPRAPSCSGRSGCWTRSTTTARTPCATLELLFRDRPERPRRARPVRPRTCSTRARRAGTRSWSPWTRKPTPGACAP